jgi:hypothetical protein
LGQRRCARIGGVQGHQSQAIETGGPISKITRAIVAGQAVRVGVDLAQRVSPCRKQGASGKNDANDAAAVCEAASRPQMHFVPVKSIEQQDMPCVHRLREGFKADRVAGINRMQWRELDAHIA